MVLPSYPPFDPVEPPSLILGWRNDTATFDRADGRVGLFVDLSEKSANPVTFDVTVTGGSLSIGQFFPDMGPFTIATGQLAGQFFFELVNNQIVAPGTIQFTLSTTTPDVGISPAVVTVTVTANVAQPGVEWSVSSVTFDEGSSTTLSILATGAATSPSVISIQQVGGTLNASTADWPGQLDLTAGAPSVPFQVSASVSGTLVLQITDCTPGRVLESDTLSITVEDVGGPLPVLSWEARTLTVDEGATVTATIELSSPLGANFPIGIQMQYGESSAESEDITIDGIHPPIAGASPPFIQKVIPSGATSLDVEVEALDDGIPDNYETATLYLVYNPAVVSSDETLRRCTVLIEDGTAPPFDPNIEEVQFETLTTNLGASATNVPIRIRRDRPSSNETVLVTVEVLESSTAILNTHVALNTLQVQITDRNETADFLATSIDTTEQRELVIRIVNILRVSGTPATGTIGERDQHSIRVGSIVPRWAQNQVRFTEGATVEVDVEIDSVRAVPITFQLQRGMGNASQVYGPVSVTIPPGETSAPVTFTSFNDGEILGQLGLYYYVDGAEGEDARLTLICDDALAVQTPRVGLVQLGGPARIGVPQRLCVEVINPDVAQWAGGSTTVLLEPTGCTLSEASVVLDGTTRYADFVMTPTTGTPRVDISGTYVDPDYDRFQAWDCAIEGRTAELRWASIPGRAGLPQVVEFTLPYLEADGSTPDIDVAGVRAQVAPYLWDEATRHPKGFRCTALVPAPAQSKPGVPGAIVVGCGNGESYAAATLQPADLSTVVLKWKIVDNDDIFTCTPFVPGSPGIKKTVTRYDGPYMRETIITVAAMLGGEELGLFKISRISRADMVCDKITVININAKVDPTDTSGDFSAAGDGVIAFDWILMEGCGGAGGTQQVVNAWDRTGDTNTEAQHYTGAGNNWTTVLTAQLLNPTHAQALMSGHGFVRRFCIYNPTTCSIEAARHIAQGRNEGLVERGFGFEEGGFVGNMPLPRWSDLPTFNFSGSSERWDALDYVGNNYLNYYLGSSGLNRNTLHGGPGQGINSKWAGWLKGCYPTDFREPGQGFIWVGGILGVGPNSGASRQLVTDLRMEMICLYAISTADWEPLNIKTYTDAFGSTLPTEFSLGYNLDLMKVPQVCDLPIDPNKADRSFYRANRSKRFRNKGSRTFPFATIWDQSDRAQWESYCTAAATHIGRELSVFTAQYWLTADYASHLALETIALPMVCGMGILPYNPSMPVSFQRGSFHRETEGNVRAVRTAGFDPITTRTGIQRVQGRQSADDGTCRRYAHPGATVLAHLMITDPATDTWSSILDADANPAFRFDALCQFQWGGVVAESGNVFVQGPDLSPDKRNGNPDGLTDIVNRTGSIPGYYSTFPNAPRSEQVPGYYRGNNGNHENYAAWFLLPLMRRLKHSGVVDWSMLPVFMRMEIIEDAISSFDPLRFTTFTYFTYAQQSVTGLPQDTPKEGPTTARGRAGWFFCSPEMDPPDGLYPAHCMGPQFAMNVAERGNLPKLFTLLQRQSGPIRGLTPQQSIYAFWEYLRQTMYNSTSNQYQAQGFPGVGALDLMRRKYPS